MTNQMKTASMTEYLLYYGYFTDPSGDMWTCTDFEKCSGRYDWFTLEEAFNAEKEYNND